MRVVKHRGKWAIEYRRDGKQTRISTGLDAIPEHYSAAQRTADEAAAAIARQVGPDCASIWGAYVTNSKAVTKDGNMKYSWKALEPFFGKIDYRKIDRPTCESYTAQRKASAGTIRKELGALKAAINWFDPKAPCVWELPPQPEARDRWLTQEEYARLKEAAAQTPHLLLFIQLALATAARKEAILAMTWLQVDFERGTINLGFKEGGKSRAKLIPISDSLRPYLEKAWAERSAQCPNVITFRGQPVRNIRTAFDAACTRANLDGVSPHVLRHTGATWQAMAGRPIEEIARFLGHSDPRTTWRIYAHHYPDYLRAAANSINV